MRHTEIAGILISFLSNLNGHSNLISHHAKRARLLPLLALLLLVPVTICRGETATEDQKEYDRILQLIYTTAGAVSTGAFDFDVFNKRLKGFVGKSVSLPLRSVVNDAHRGSMNAICVSDPHATSFMVVAANKTNTTIHAFEYVTLQHAVDFAAHVGESASITGTLRRIEPNPNKSRAIVLRIYIDDATVAFSKKTAHRAVATTVALN